MRALHINNTSHTGGAARAMQRLHFTMKEKGHESRILVGRSIFPEDPEISIIWDEVSEFRSLSKSIKSRIGNKLEKHLIPNDYDTQAFLYDLNTKKVEPISKDFNPSPTK